MSDVEDAIVATRPAWGPLPAPLSKALDWMQQCGYAVQHGDDYFLTPYAGNAQRGVVFRSGLTFEGWLEDDHPALERLLPIAESDSAGGMIALWRDSNGEEPRAVLINALDAVVIADDVTELLQLIAIGHDEVQAYTVSSNPEPASAEAHAEFRAWVADEFDLEIPEAWDLVGKDSFTDWWLEQTGHETSAEPQPANSRLDHEAPGAEMRGPISTLIGLLGEEDNLSTAQSLGAFLGIEVGESLKMGARRLQKFGLELSLTRNHLSTVWVHIGFEAEGITGGPPTEHPWWSGPELIEGLTKHSTMSEVIALFGEPESSGKRWVRYRIDGRYIHITFGLDGLALITLMTTAP